MSAGNLLTLDTIQEHYTLLSERLSGVPELRPVFESSAVLSGHACDVYLGYVALVTAMAELSLDDVQTITRSQSMLMQSGSESGSASMIGANDLVNALGDRRGMLIQLVNESVNPQSTHYQKAVDNLVVKLEGGHRLKLNGQSPSDDDPESLKVIWGHTVISEPEALLHFVTCHYLGLYYAEAFVEAGFDFATQKDFFVNALTDVVILNRLRSDSSNAIFDTWNTPKQAGGMGWITPARLESYKQQLKHYTV